MPAFLALSALGGGLVYRLAPLAFALLLVIGKAFGEAFKDVEWRQDDERKDHNYSDESDPMRNRHDAYDGTIRILQEGS